LGYNLAASFLHRLARISAHISCQISAYLKSFSFTLGKLPGQVPMTPQKLVVLITTLLGGALGLFAPVGVVKWLLQTEPEDAGILTVFFFPVWCLLLVLGLLIGRRLGLLVTGGRRVAQRAEIGRYARRHAKKAPRIAGLFPVFRWPFPSVRWLRRVWIRRTGTNRFR
jgi:hypothetical protein